jgi:predicted tellurium resistance membrane protein TerC
VVVSGGILGILAMRLVVGQLLVVVERYPSLVDGAFIIIGWVAIKLVGEYADSAGYVDFEIPHWTSLVVIVLVLAVAYVWGRIKGPLPPHEEAPQLDEP